MEFSNNGYVYILLTYFSIFLMYIFWFLIVVIASWKELQFRSLIIWWTFLKYYNCLKSSICLVFGLWSVSYWSFLDLLVFRVFEGVWSESLRVSTTIEFWSIISWLEWCWVWSLCDWIPLSPVLECDCFWNLAWI